MAKPLTTIDILGNTWSARHLAKFLVNQNAGAYQLRLWNEGKTASPQELQIETFPKMMLVPDFLKEHMGLGFRTNVENPVIHHRRRQRDAWLDAEQTAKNLGCCTEVLALLYNLIFFNSYGASVLAGQTQLKGINYDWDKDYNASGGATYTPANTVLASKSSIERVWDNVLEHDGVTLNFNSPIRVESVRKPSSATSLALILSAPNGVQDDTNHVVKTNIKTDLHWMWKSYQCVISRELAASIPRFFIWIDEEKGEDFLSTGLLYDGAILRCISVPLPQSDDKILLQVDRLSEISLQELINPQDFFKGSPWYALESQEWTELLHNIPDDLIYGAKVNADNALKKIIKSPTSSLGVSASGVDHHVLVNS